MTIFRDIFILIWPAFRILILFCRLTLSVCVCVCVCGGGGGVDFIGQFFLVGSSGHYLKFSLGEYVAELQLID